MALKWMAGMMAGVLMCIGTASAADIATQKMVLRGVDKITGRVKTMEAMVNQPLKFGTLTIIPERCLTKPQEEMPENAVYLQIFEAVKEAPQKQIFKGWMFSSNPALSPLEHPIYDVWLLQCINQDITEDLVQPLPVEREKDMHLIADDDNPALAQEAEGNEENTLHSLPQGTILDAGKEALIQEPAPQTARVLQN